MASLFERTALLKTNHEIRATLTQAPMKRLLANRPDWRRILRRRCYQTYLSDPGFRGYAALLCLDAVREPLVVQTKSGP